MNTCEYICVEIRVYNNNKKNLVWIFGHGVLHKESSNLGNCYYCKKPGHFKRDCLKRQKALKKAGKRSDGASTSGKSKQAGVVEEDLCEVLTAHSGQGKLSDVWLLDSGATYHMCPRREWFSTYQPWDGGSVLMGNNAECNIIGAGNIRMRMFDGQVRTLTNVRHVPDMRKNLLLLGALEAQGFRFSGEAESSRYRGAP